MDSEREKVVVSIIGLIALCVATVSLIDLPIAANMLTSIGTFTLAFFAFMEIRNSRRERMLANLDRDVERVLRSTSLDFLPALSFLIERWWNDKDIGRQVREMQKYYDEKRRSFKEAARSLRPDIVSLKKAMLEAHPDTADDKEVGRSVAETLQGQNLDLSFARFDQLADGVELVDAEKPHSTTYNSPPDSRDVENEEPIIERQMLKIVDARLNNLWFKKKLGGSNVDDDVQGTYVQLDINCSRFELEFADWKRVMPERAMRELLAMSKSQGRRVAQDTEPEIDAEGWLMSLALDDNPTSDFEEFYKGLLKLAADGLRTRFASDQGWSVRRLFGG